MFKNVINTFVRLNQTSNVFVKRHAGHSKWQNIRHIKGAKDAARGKLFTRLSRQMKVAIQEGGSSDANKNFKLENVIEQARRNNMPQATIQSVIKSCENDKTNSKSHLFEIKGPGGCIVLCEVFTNHLHSSKQSIATILRKHQCRFSDGGGMHLFQEKGIVEAEFSSEIDSNSVLDLATDHAIEAGAEEVSLVEDSNTLQFICGATNLKSVTHNLENFKYNITSATTEFVPLKLQELDESDLKLSESLFEKLEGLPEVVKLSDNIK